MASSHTQKTYADIAKFVSNVMSKGSAMPNPDHILTLANEAIGEISDILGPVETSWDNTATGDLTLVGNSFAIPIDCTKPTRVDWDGVKIDRMSQAEFESYDEDWRNSTGDPGAWYSDGSSIYLDSTPSSSVGRLILYGLGMIPELSNAVNAANPLIYIPARYQLLPAYYILANIEAKAKVEAREAGGTVVKITDTSEIERQQRYQAKWNDGLAKLAEAYDKRQHEPFTTGLGGLEYGN